MTNCVAEASEPGAIHSSETRDDPEPLRISNHARLSDLPWSRCTLTQSLPELTRSLWLSHDTAVPWALYCTSIPDSRPMLLSNADTGFAERPPRPHPFFEP